MDEEADVSLVRVIQYTLVQASASALLLRLGFHQQRMPFMDCTFSAFCHIFQSNSKCEKMKSFND